SPVSGGNSLPTVAEPQISPTTRSAAVSTHGKSFLCVQFLHARRRGDCRSDGRLPRGTVGALHRSSARGFSEATPRRRVRAKPGGTDARDAHTERSWTCTN